MAAATSSAKGLARAVVRATGLMGVYVRMFELRRALRFPRPPALAPDGKPIPNRLQMVRIGGHSDWKFFYERGRITASALVDAAMKAGADPAKWTRVLDWGCGCGRISRHMSSLTPATIIGRDIDAYTVGWAARHLEGDYGPCRLNPPLDLPDASIDFAYAFSVLTHLAGDTQVRWLAELGRIIRPGGLAILTFHDSRHPDYVRVTHRHEAAGVSTNEKAMEGSNLVAAFQEIDSIATAGSPWFELVQHVPSDETPIEQAMAVLRRR